MAWTSPSGHVYVTGEIVTAATLNTYVKDDLIDLDRRTSPVRGLVTTLQSTTSLTFTDLATAGPAVTVTVGATGKVLFAAWCRQYNVTSGQVSLMSCAVTGATTVAATDEFALTFTSPTANGDVRHGGTFVIDALNSGSTTFTSKYRATGGTATFESRLISVTPLGS